MKPIVRALIVTALVAGQGLAGAGPRYYDRYHHHHHHHHRGPSAGAVVLGLALAVPLIALASRADRAPDVVYAPPPPPPPPVQTVYVPAPVLSAAPSRPAPVIYPRNGQGAEQLEFDRRDCNRWATTQQAAMADSDVFNRAVEACMDGRGYTLR
ncbi:hypothetical protein ACG04Q_12940 [Roseateles sp. DXS20W]|uniref:UrcA family protein n=1 Tax=Pelomonas lactea TaxID=3299030 RepID=A0ABW7GKJ6_9BURK